MASALLSSWLALLATTRSTLGVFIPATACAAGSADDGSTDAAPPGCAIAAATSIPLEAAAAANCRSTRQFSRATSSLLPSKLSLSRNSARRGSAAAMRSNRSSTSRSTPAYDVHVRQHVCVQARVCYHFQDARACAVYLYLSDFLTCPCNASLPPLSLLVPSTSTHAVAPPLSFHIFSSFTHVVVRPSP